MKAGPCPPATQAPTCTGDIETWAGSPETGDTSREDVSDMGARYLTSLLVLMEDALLANYV